MSRLMTLRSGASFIQNFPNCGFLSVLPNSLVQKKIKLHNQDRSLSSGVVQSPLGPCKKIPSENVVEFIFKNNENWIEEPAATCGVSGRSFTFGMLRMLINRCAQALLGHCGMRPREVVGLLLPNIPEYIIVSHGALEAGLTVTFVNPLYTPDEIKRQFENAGVKMIVTIPLLLEVATTIAPQLRDYRTTICIGGDDDPLNNVHGLQSLLSAGHASDIPGINPREIAILPYSSGTTGLPKGVMLSHYNLVANLIQGEHPALEDVESREGKRHTVLTALPFFHIYGFNGILNMCLKNGVHIVSIPKFTPEDYIKTLVKYKPTFVCVVPSLLLFLATHPAVTKDHLSSIEAVQSGAAPLTEGLLQKFRQKVGRDDILIRQGYGMTESAPVTFCMPKLTPASKIGTIGIPYPGTEAKIISLKDGEELGTHKSGELLVRGPQLMMGYLNNEQATAETIDEEGWLHTGDVAYYDEDHYFYIVDRCKELIKVKGNQVSPTELENLLLEMPGVADAAVVGIPDALADEIPRAFVVRHPGSSINEDDVLLYVNPKVVNYKKIAGGVKFVESIPRNPSGKILRNELKINP
ncbi:uncharacterized protein BDFB_006543 [Asbolus verrucosus]|uniref:Luciferin 4-monooxygenase n=1 Tax=Asbolus verrucosus TaxID=1661398 RepID=A0A482VCP0_ASBVE|nr:uncharacterized protein BDFB_006543 [Asbolus verrucosus]